MSGSQQPKRRCAIYTRKSTSEGLEDEITSLDVQRQAGESYIKSQLQEGWVCLPEGYDDGGFSGADLKRPAVERLLGDIEAGHIDVVVVYKVDRLSRSLLDFARLVSVFDQHGVAFVSVTQQFNTADSMGRLTLNVLLSFAQFERELIAERTRDKMAMARRRGRWTGGTPVLGYDLSDRQLVVNQEEAKRVRSIFELYVDLGSLGKTVGQLNRRRWRSKRWTTKKGRQRGGRLFRKSSLYHLLTNITYLGKVRYKQTVYEGRHESIVNEDLFDQVQQRLVAQRPRRRYAMENQRRVTLLAGLLNCGSCTVPMEATYTTRGSRRYRYYVCRQGASCGGNGCRGVSLPAAEIERYVIAAVLQGATDDERLSPEENREQVTALVERIEYDAASSRLTIHWKAATGRAPLLRELHFRTGRLGRRRLSDDGLPVEGSQPELVPRLARLMALALRMETLVRESRVSDYAELARLGHVSRARLSQILGLTLLAPDIQEALLFLPGGPSGRDALTERQLRPIVAEPDWRRQRRMWRQLPSAAQ